MSQRTRDDVDIELVRRILAHPDEYSRNRNYYLYDSPEWRRALRSSRLLASVADYTRRFRDARLSARRRGRAALEVKVEVGSINLVRVVLLSKGEYDLLQGMLQTPAG